MEDTFASHSGYYKKYMYAVGAFIALLLNWCVCEGNDSNKLTRNSSKAEESGHSVKERLISSIKSLEPWTNKKYEKESWQKMFEAALTIQKAKPEIVEKALREFIIQTTWLDDSDKQWSKVFLLLRVVFELPDASPPSEARFFGGWLIPWRVQKTEGKVNLSWPIAWDKDGPKLTAEFEGYQGPPYLAEREYMYYLKKYPFRKNK